MYSRIVVPVDCSELAWAAIGPARQLAHQWGAELEVVSVVHYGWEIEHATADIERYLATCGWQEGTIVTVFETRVRQVAEVIADHLEMHAGSFVVMTSHGRGRSAALFGSVAEMLLRAIDGPIMVLGPSIDGDYLEFAGKMLVCVDGSKTSEVAIDIAGPWARELELEPWVVSVAEEVSAVIGGEAVVETAYPHRMADRLSKQIGSEVEVEYETLHRKDPARALADFARSYDAGLIVAATHGRTGFDRLSEGSVAMDIVHSAPCPVLLIRSLTDADRDG